MGNDATLRAIRPPRRSGKARAWQRYYERRASWFADMAINLAQYPRAATLAQAEAERYRDGARELREGRHPNQRDGTWR